MLVSQSYVWAFMFAVLVMVIGGIIEAANQNEGSARLSFGAAFGIIVATCLISFMAGPRFDGEVISVSAETAVVAVWDFPLAVSDGGLSLEKGDNATVMKVEGNWEVIKVTREAKKK